MENEIWIDVIGYEGKYQVSNTGKVRSLNYNNTRGLVRELKQKINRYGYMQVSLSKNNIKKDFMVGRLVATHFIPNPNYKDVVIHLKDNKDNSVENLRWAYHSESKHNMYNKGSRKIGKPTYTKITYKGKNYKNYSSIAKNKGINIKSFFNRMYLGWSLYEAIDVPVGRRNNEK